METFTLLAERAAAYPHVIRRPQLCRPEPFRGPDRRAPAHRRIHVPAPSAPFPGRLKR